jgi:hypothetical protein
MSTSKRLLVYLLSGLILSLGLAGLARAAGPTLSVDPDDTPLVIRGTLAEKSATFSGNVRLTATGGDAETLQLLPSDLPHTTAPGVVIDRSQVAIPAGISLSDGQPRDVTVTVSNVKRPGTYSGEVKFLLPGQAEAEALVIPLELQVDAQPSVVPVEASLAVQVTRCQAFFDCALAAWLLPASMLREQWPVQLNNQTPVPVEVTEGMVLLRGDRTGRTPGTNEVSLDVPHTLPANQIEAVNLAVRRSDLSPDRYQGLLRFTLAGADTPAEVKIDLDVRDGPFWPLVVILLGIIAGRLARGMETEAARLQLKLYPRYAQQKAAATAVQDPAGTAFLEKQLDAFKQKLDAGQDTEEALTQALEKLEAQIDFLASLEELERQLAGQSLDALKAELTPQIKGARQALLEGKNSEAERLRRQVETRLRQAQEDGTMGRAADIFNNLLKTFRASGDRLAATQALPPAERPGGARWGWLARLLAALAGGRIIKAEVRFWLLRPLFFLLLLALLALLGLQTLYINAGATFGAAGLYDYLGLFLWGLTADVAQRTLQNVQSAEK